MTGRAAVRTWMPPGVIPFSVPPWACPWTMRSAPAASIAPLSREWPRKGEGLPPVADQGAPDRGVSMAAGGTLGSYPGREPAMRPPPRPLRSARSRSQSLASPSERWTG
jgi:hypothetical protein